MMVLGRDPDQRSIRLEGSQPTEGSADQDFAGKPGIFVAKHL